MTPPGRRAARSAIGRAVQTAIILTDNLGQPMTPSNVWANAQTQGLHQSLTIAEMQRVVNQAVQLHIPIALKRMGYLIADDSTRERVPFGECSTLEVQVQLDIKTDSISFDQRHHRALANTQALLVASSRTAGRQVLAAEERPAIEAIYAAEGLASPFR